MVVLLSCSEKKEFGSQENVVKESSLTITEVLKPVNYDRPVKVSGVVTKVCQTEGCWMAVGDDKSKIRVMFNEGKFTVPLNSSGKKVKMEGKVVNEVVDGETATMWWSHIDSVVSNPTTDQRVPIFMATSVTFE